MPTTWLVKDIMDDTARECSITPPSSWLSDTGTTFVQFRNFLKSSVRELLQRHDWAAISTDTTFTGAGSSFDLPSDFLRLCEDENAVYETSPMRRRVMPIPVRGSWTETQEWNWTGVQRYYRLQGSTIEFLDTLPADAEIKMAYVQDTWLVDVDDARSNTWDGIGDVSLIPGHLIQLNLVWRWRRHKGMTYADRKAEFESEFARAVGDDGPTRRVEFTGRKPDERRPWQLPVPDFIPSS